MRAVQRLQFEAAMLAPDRPTLIDRYLGRDDHALHAQWALPAAVTGLGDMQLALHDTRGAVTEITTRENATAIWHVLWVRDESAARFSIGDHTWPIAPGDTVLVPPATPVRIESRQLAVKVVIPGVHVPVAPPTHGEERFFGHNRQTVCCRAGDIRLCRWKLTQPLALAEHHPGPVFVMALARDSIIRTSRGIDQLVQGELALLDPAADPIVTPDGLSYLLTIDRTLPAERP